MIKLFLLTLLALFVTVISINIFQVWCKQNPAKAFILEEYPIWSYIFVSGGVITTIILALVTLIYTLFTI